MANRLVCAKILALDSLVVLAWLRKMKRGSVIDQSPFDFCCKSSPFLSALDLISYLYLCILYPSFFLFSYSSWFFTTFFFTIITTSTASTSISPIHTSLYYTRPSSVDPDSSGIWGRETRVESRAALGPWESVQPRYASVSLQTDSTGHDLYT